ncbi:KIF-binding protein [Bradysia coprophila]|uniref:KIF-binding protein n=1 Tax=Bradysia coprophila TaxID=38358 RepID=UPI00187D8071|nr:KIF-binding protein [Bradysia coprophila]
MSISKEQLSDYKDKYEEAENLVEVDSKHDPPTEPYRSHYKAMEILVEMQQNLKNLLNDLPEDENDDTRRLLLYILGFLYKDTGRICVWTQELTNGEKDLMKCLELLEPYKMNQECVNAYLGALNQIGVLWSNRNDATTSKEYLERADKLFNEFKASKKSPFTIYDIFGSKDEIEHGKGMDMLEQTHTLTLYYLAQILGVLGDLHQSAVLCHRTLQRQLEFNDYEHVDWALNAATLSQYFFQNDRHTESRHHLAAASYIMGKYESQMLQPEMSEDERSAVLEVFNHRSADINRCWAKYGLNLLLESRNRLMKDDEDDSDKDKIQEGMEKVSLGEQCKFESLAIGPFEDVITDQYALMFDDAKPIFLAIQTWLNKAKEYYTLDSEASEYAKIVQDQASAYKYLAFYDFDDGNRCKLHKRQADLLEGLLTMNPTYYMNICREVWFELGSTYSTMMDIKLEAFEKLKIQENPRPHVINKINLLCQKSITKFQEFIDSYSDKGTNELRKNIPADEMQPILFTYFQIGRLYYKFITPDKKSQITNVSNCLKYYTLFMKTYDENKPLAEHFKQEYGVCREMVELLPLKIMKLRSEAEGSA